MKIPFSLLAVFDEMKPLLWHVPKYKTELRIFGMKKRHVLVEELRSNSSYIYLLLRNRPEEELRVPSSCPKLTVVLQVAWENEDQEKEDQSLLFR